MRKNKMRLRETVVFFLLTFITMAAMSACAPAPRGTEDDSASFPPDSAEHDPVNPQAPASPQDPKDPRSYSTAVLLFNGEGISTSDWQSTEGIVKSMGLSYELVNSSELNAMTAQKLASFGLILVPGGHGSAITDALSDSTRIRVRQAVRDIGVSYLGICAGAWVGVEEEALTNVPTYGFSVAPGKYLTVWLPPANPSATADVVPVTFPDGSSRHLVWWGGPATPNWPGGVVARYSTGHPAVSQTWSGKGFVLLTGPHPEAPQGWRNTAGSDPDGLDFELTKTMIRSALERKPLPVF